MIQAMEAHLAAWAQRQIQALSTESELFGHVRAVAGQLTLPQGPPLGPTEIAALVRVTALEPQPENRDLGPRPITEGAALQLRAEVTFRLLGRDTPYPAGAGLLLTPPAAECHRVDVAALTLLALLKEQPGPSPDGAVLPLIDHDRGEKPAGAASAAEGSRRAQLAWTAWEIGSILLTPTSPEKIRQWEIALTASCQYRLSPAALSGGRILQIGGETVLQDQPIRQMEARLYAPAEAISLGWFDGLSDGLIAELAENGLTTLGDLGRLGPARTNALASELRTASAAEADHLVQIATMAAGRKSGLALPPQYRQEPTAFALPARVLLAPTPEESAILNDLFISPEAEAQVIMLASSVITALKPSHREKVALGTFLARGR